MELKKFRIENYRSINDTGWINASKLTALLGRNESGKSNILRALHSLNPAGGIKPLNKVKDFPRHRRLSECTDMTPVVSTLWSLSDEDRSEIEDLWSEGKAAASVSINRRYDAEHTVAINGVISPTYDKKDIETAIKKVKAAIEAKADELDGEAKSRLNAAAAKFATSAAPSNTSTSWVVAAKAAAEEIRKSLAAADKEITSTQETHLIWIEQRAEDIANFEAGAAKARLWAIENLPVFIYLDDYPQFAGHQNIAKYLERLANNALTDADKNFEKLCKVAGLNPKELQELLGKKETETRNQLANRASSVITTQIRKLWKDRALKVRFDPDAEYINTFVSDPNATFDVEVNLDERSRGFQWFFSFYVTFAADTDGGDAENAVLLLDEPGLYLHAKSQRDLLTHFESGFTNQIIYSTHSPFMVPTHRLDWVRTVSISEDKGTTVSNDPSGDSRTLFPLQAALGYDLAQSLFIGPKNLVVEGVTDFWALSTVSDYLHENGGGGLRPDVTITPAGGAQKIPYMVALLTSEQLDVVALLDHEKDAQATRDELVRTKLIQDKRLVSIVDAFLVSPPKEADIEDLFEAAIYEDLVRHVYKKELGSTAISLNVNIPRLAKRFEAAFKDAGLEFNKTRPMRHLLSVMATKPDSVVTTETAARFRTLFGKINGLWKK